MNKKELYLYGTLLALAEEQNEAISKLVSNELGWFGKNRIQGRGREIGKFVTKIAKEKQSRGIGDIKTSILEDLTKIKNGDFPKKYKESDVDMIKNYL